MSNPYDKMYRDCLAHARMEMLALEAEVRIIQKRLAYIKGRRRRLETAVVALSDLLDYAEDVPFGERGEQTEDAHA